MQDILDFYRHTIIHVINYNLMIIIHDRFANACRSFRRFMYIIHIDTTDKYRFGSTPISFVYICCSWSSKENSCGDTVGLMHGLLRLTGRSNDYYISKANKSIKHNKDMETYFGGQGFGLKLRYNLVCFKICK